MDIDTNCDLDALQTAIEAQIRAQFPAMKIVEFDREVRDKLPTPSLLLELAEFEPADEGADAGTGQLMVDMTFEARFIYGFRGAPQRDVKRFAAAFAAWIHLKQWAGICCGPARFVGAHPDQFSPELDEYTVWRLTWAQAVFLGQTVWTPGVRPSSVWLQENIDGQPVGPEIPVTDA